MLPLVDEHCVTLGASPDAVWRRLVAYVAGMDGAWVRGYAGLVGTEPRHADGTVPAPGSSVPGFAVRSVEPVRRLLLEGRHRFSRYTLTFDLAPSEGGTLLRARTNAEFPGPHGRLYRLAVIDSGIHRTLMRRILRKIADLA